MNQNTKSHSLLYNIYNGIMMGFFLGTGGFASNADSSRYPSLRKRLLNFSLEIGVPLDLPEDSEKYKNEAGNILESFLGELNRNRIDLSVFVIFGISFMEYCIHKCFNHEELIQLNKKTLNMIMHDAHLTKINIDEYANNIEIKRDGISMNSLHSVSLSLVNEIISQLPEEEKTAFVVMPFSEPYDSNYVSFYRPLMSKFGYETIRAWGDISQENYYPMSLLQNESADQ
ncbi:MAG: hypothetical protein KQH63_08975 [Desulfobulbaceae bacterium]|nr:hypothetical protein [Desulfobulbaceae bacterium]